MIALVGIYKLYRRGTDASDVHSDDWHVTSKQTADDEQRAEKKVELGSVVSDGPLWSSLPERALQLKCIRYRHQRKAEHPRRLRAPKDKDKIRCKQQQSEEKVGALSAKQHRQGNHPSTLVGLHLPHVFAVDDGLRAERQGKGKEQRPEREPPGLGDEREEHGERPEGEDDHQVAQDVVLEADTARVEERAGETAEEQRR